MSDKGRNIEDITLDLGEVYFIQKEAATELAQFRIEFFAGVTALFDNDDLAQKTVEVPDVEDPQKFAETYNPGWRVLLVHDDEQPYRVVLQEDPEYLPYFYVNPVDKNVYQRSIISGSLVLDDERLKKDDPDLWRQATYYPQWDVYAEIAYNAGVDHLEITEWLEDRLESFGAERVAKPLEALDKETIAALQPYFHEGPKQIKLSAVREAKREELESLVE